MLSTGTYRFGEHNLFLQIGAEAFLRTDGLDLRICDLSALQTWIETLGTKYESYTNSNTALDLIQPFQQTDSVDFFSTAVPTDDPIVVQCREGKSPFSQNTPSKWLYHTPPGTVWRKKLDKLTLYLCVLPGLSNAGALALFGTHEGVALPPIWQCGAMLLPSMEVRHVLNFFGGYPLEKLPDSLVKTVGSMTPANNGYHKIYAEGYTAGKYPEKAIELGHRIALHRSKTGLLRDITFYLGSNSASLLNLPGVNPSPLEAVLPYNEETTARLSQWFEILSHPESEWIDRINSMIPTLSYETPIEIYGHSWELEALAKVPVGTLIQVKTAPYVTSLFLRLDNNLWYSHPAGMIGSFENTLSHHFSLGWGKSYTVQIFDLTKSRPDFPNADKALDIWGSFADSTSQFAKASKKTNKLFVHWHELAHVKVPDSITDSVKALQSIAFAGGLPWWLPRPGTVLRLDKRDDDTFGYLVFLSNNASHLFKDDCIQYDCLLLTYEGDKWVSTSGLLQALVAKYLGQNSLTVGSLRKVLNLNNFDHGVHSKVEEALTAVPLITPKYKKCLLAPKDCFHAGGQGRRFHAEDTEYHPVSWTKSKNKINNQILWATTETAHKDTDYSLACDKQGVILKKKNKVINTFTYEDLDASSGIIGDFDLADWGISWIATPKIYLPGSYLPDLPVKVQALVNSLYDNGKNAAGYLPSLLNGSVLVQFRREGTLYGVVSNGFIQDSLDRRWALSAPTVKETWGNDLSSLNIEPYVLPPFLEHNKVYTAPLPELNTSMQTVLKGVRPANVAPFGNTGTYVVVPDHGGNKVSAIVVVMEGFLYVYNLVGQRITTVRIGQSKAEDIKLSVIYGFKPAPIPTPVTVGDFTYNVFPLQSAPAGLPDKLYNVVFQELDLKKKGTELIKGVTTYGHLIEVLKDGKQVAWFFDLAKRWNIWIQNERTSIFQEDTTEPEAALMASIGFEVPVTGKVATTEPPVIQLHAPEEYPDPSQLTPTGQMMKGTSFTHEVLQSKDKNKYLWKKLPENFDPFVSIAEDVGSLIAYMILGNKAVYAKECHYNGVKGTLQPLLPTGSKLVGKETSPTALSEEILIQFMMQHPVDWLISNHDTHGNQYIITPDQILVGLDKGQSWKHFPGDSLSVTYCPNKDTGVNGPYFYLVYELLKSGKFDRDKVFAALATVIARIKFASEDALKEQFARLATAKFKKEADREKFVTEAIQRKRNIDKDFNDFLTTTFGEEISLSHYAKELKLTILDKVVFSFPAPSAVSVETEEVPEEYHEVEVKTSFMDIATKHGIKIETHNKKDYLAVCYHASKETLKAFVTESGLKTIGNDTDKDGKKLDGYKKTSIGWMTVIHKVAYEKGNKVTKQKEIKTHAKVVIKQKTNGPKLPPTTYIVPVGTGSPLQVTDHVPLMHAFQGRTHNYDDIHVITQVPKFPRGGANIFLGSPYILNNYLNIIKVRIDEQFVFEMTFRVDQDEIASKVSITGSDTFKFNQRTYHNDKGMYEEDGGSSGQMSLANFKSKYKKFDDDSEIWVFDDDTYKKFAMSGTIVIRIPVSRFNTGKTLEQLLHALLEECKLKGAKIKALDELIVPPTPESLERIKLMKACFSRLPWDKKSKINYYADNAIQVMEKALSDSGINVKDLVLSYLADGHVSTVHKGSAKSLFEKAPFVNALTHGGSTEHVPSVLKHGLLSPIERSRRGVSSAGIVNARDFLTGGAETIMCMIGNQSSYSNSEGKVSYLLSPNQLERTDIYFHNQDLYGCLNTKEHSLSGRPSVHDFIKNAGTIAHTNELVLFHSVPVSAIIGCYVGSEATKKQVCAACKAENIHVVNGQPIEEFIRVGKDYKVMTNLTKEAVKANYSGPPTESLSK